MFCRKCGRQLRDGSVFCAYCGSRTVQSDGAPQTGSGYENAGSVHTNGPGNYAQQPGNGHFYQPGHRAASNIILTIPADPICRGRDMEPVRRIRAFIRPAART